MVIRYAAAALLIGALGAPSASAEKLNYLPQIIDMTELIPPPPPPGSDAQRIDLGDVIDVQAARTERQVARAIADNVLSIYRFDDVLRPKFKRENLPVTDALGRRKRTRAPS